MRKEYEISKMKGHRNPHAKRLHTSQQTISRLESPRNGSLSLRTLVKLAHALGKEVKVQFV